MEKTIKIEEKEIRLCNNVGWILIYKDQFGRDIIPALAPALASIIDVVAGIIRETGGKKELDITEALALLDGDTLTDALIHISGLEFTDFVNITWSMAKCADENIREPLIWVRQFDTFPVDVIGPVVFELIFRGLVSSKNWERLRSEISRIKLTRPSTQKPSSSQVSSEDWHCRTSKACSSAL